VTARHRILGLATRPGRALRTASPALFVRALTVSAPGVLGNDYARGGLIRAFDWGQGPVTAVAFAPGGHPCAAGSGAGLVSLWDLGG
jgi:WD40 repeat protein